MAARELLRERAYADISARDLVAASDTNLGSIGYHFGSKDALLYEAIGLALEEWSQATINVAIGDADSARDTIVSAAAHILDNYDTVRPYYQAFVAALARSAQSPELSNQLAEHYNRQRDRVSSAVARVFDADPETARNIASVIVALVDGLMVQSYVAKADTPTGGELPTLATVMADALQHR